MAVTVDTLYDTPLLLLLVLETKLDTPCQYQRQVAEL